MTDHVRPYTPLTSENAALILVDHQVGFMTGVRDYSTGEWKHNVVALAKAAKALKLPIIVTTTAGDSMWGPTFPELVEALPGVEIIDRSSVNAFDDARVAHAIEAPGRKKLIFAGISLEVCAAFPAISAIDKGYDAYVAVDASGAAFVADFDPAGRGRCDSSDQTIRKQFNLAASEPWQTAME